MLKSTKAKNARTAMPLVLDMLDALADHPGVDDPAISWNAKGGATVNVFLDGDDMKATLSLDDYDFRGDGIDLDPFAASQLAGVASHVAARLEATGRYHGTAVMMRSDRVVLAFTTVDGRGESARGAWIFARD